MQAGFNVGAKAPGALSCEVQGRYRRRR